LHFSDALPSSAFFWTPAHGLVEFSSSVAVKKSKWGKGKLAANRCIYWQSLRVFRGTRGDVMAGREMNRTIYPYPLADRASRAFRRSEKGAELVEFAFVLAALMMLTLGFVSFSRAYNVYQTITRAAREGAREAVLPTSVYDGNKYIDNNATFTSPDSPIFLNYIKPSLTAANLNPNACASSSQVGCVANYKEQVGWLNPGGSDQQCGITIGFTYPYRLNIPFTSVSLMTLQLHTDVRMRLENANYQQTGNGTYQVVCP
jgi:hypothetical protein